MNVDFYYHFVNRPRALFPVTRLWIAHFQLIIHNFISIIGRIMNISTIKIMIISNETDDIL